MPIYQYRFNQCHHELEALRKMSDHNLVDGSEWWASALEKQATSAACKLKRLDWFEADFKNAGAKLNSKTNSPKETAISAQ